MARGGPVFDQEKADLVIELLEKGNYLETACSIAGLSERTVYSWINGERSKKNPKVQAFVQAIKKARASAESKWLNVVARAAEGYPVIKEKKKTYSRMVNGKKVDITETETSTEIRFDWQAAMTVMERAYPERWGRKMSIDALKMKAEEEGPTSEELPKDFLTSAKKKPKQEKQEEATA